MGCKYLKETSYKEFPQCEAENCICVMLRRCTDKMCWIPNGDMDNCKIKQKKDKECPKGYYSVRYVYHKKAYIEIDGEVVAIPYDGEYKPFVKLRKTKNGYKVVTDE